MHAPIHFRILIAASGSHQIQAGIAEVGPVSTHFVMTVAHLSAGSVEGNKSSVQLIEEEASRTNFALNDTCATCPSIFSH